MEYEKTSVPRASVYVRARLGEESVKTLFSEIWYCYYARLFVFVRNMSIHQDEVEDAVQEIMLKALSNLERYSMKYAVSTWLYTIARNYCLDVLRKERTRSVHVSSNQSEDLKSRYPEPEVALLISEEEQEIKSIIGKLGDSDRQIAFLRFYEDSSYGRIAEILGLPIGTVKYRVHAIRRVFRKKRSEIHAQDI